MGQGQGNLQQISTFRAIIGSEKYQVEALATTCGRDVSVIIGGGTLYHIGATALATPRASLADSERISASASVICVTGHKDDELARSAALSLASFLRCIVTVNVGLHIDEATAEDINILVSNYHLVLDQIKAKLSEHFR